MATTWNGVGYLNHIPQYIYDVTGSWPSTTGITRASQSVTSTSYTTLLNISSGPYILCGFRVDPNANDNGLYLKATIDGSLVIGDSFFTGPTGGDNHLVGQYFNDSSHAPILCRTSIKLEAKYTALNGTDSAEWIYVSYSLS